MIWQNYQCVLLEDIGHKDDMPYLCLPHHSISDNHKGYYRLTMAW